VDNTLRLRDAKAPQMREALYPRADTRGVARGTVPGSRCQTAVQSEALRHVALLWENQVPEHVRDEIRLEHSVRGKSITIVKRRPPWSEIIGPEWTSMNIAEQASSRAECHGQLDGQESRALSWRRRLRPASERTAGRPEASSSST
jgi:hypothetical protein